jgi:hypothetical protein
VGYNKTSKAYRIFNSFNRKKFVRRDVKFEEKLASTRSQESLVVIEDEEKQAPKDE